LSRRLLIPLVTVIAVLGVSVGLATAFVSGPHIKAEGTETFERNALIQSTFRWSPELVQVPSGGTIKFSSETLGGDPHTISVVRQGERPSTVEEVFNCTICNTIFNKLDGNTVYDPGNDGLNAPLDTWLLFTGQKLTLTVSAPAGTKLYFMCAIHPWMQGIIDVTS